MRAERVLALLLLAGCADDAPAPEPAVVEALVDVQLAEAQASLTGADPDSARRAALAARSVAPATFDRWLDRASENPDDAAALWEAVAGRLDAERLAAPR